MRKILLRFENVVTEQDGVKGLNRFSFLIGSGEMVGMVIINQQGITDLIDVILHHTLIKSGRVFFANELNNLEKRNRTSIVDRQIRLVQGISVAENLFVFQENFNSFFIKHKLLEREAQKILDNYHISLLATTNTKQLNQLERIQIELLKEMIAGTKLLILKDLGKLLNSSDLNQLISFIKRLVAEGISFLYVGSYPDDIFHHCCRVAIYNEGIVQKILYSDQINKGNLLPPSIVSNPAKIQDKNPILKLSCFSKKNTQLFTTVVSSGECLSILDRNQLFTTSLFELVKSRKNTNEWSIEFMNKGKKSTLFFIPENSTQKSLFHDCSYMFNLCFLLNTKMKKSIISSKILKSIKQEFKEEIGDKHELSSISNLDKYELLNLVYYRVLLLNPDVIFIFQPFMDIDMDLQTHTLMLINKLKQRAIGVIVLTSYLANLENVSDEVIRLDTKNYSLE